MLRLLKSPLILFGLTILFFDMVSKALITRFIPEVGFATLFYPYRGVPVFKDFLGIELSIVHTTNKGAAWGYFAAYQKELLLFRILLCMGLALYLFFFNRNKENSFPLTLVLAGAIGNILDYFIYGHVIDMIHVVLWGYDFPVFNIADSFITIGILWISIHSWVHGHKRTLKKIS